MLKRLFIRVELGEENMHKHAKDEEAAVLAS